MTAAVARHETKITRGAAWSQICLVSRSIKEGRFLGNVRHHPPSALFRSSSGSRLTAVHPAAGALSTSILHDTARGRLQRMRIAFACGPRVVAAARIEVDSAFAVVWNVGHWPGKYMCHTLVPLIADYASCPLPR